MGATCDGDVFDSDGDDGAILGTIWVGALDAIVTVNVVDGPGKLDAWADFNGDGNWGGPNEQIFASLAVSADSDVLPFDVPAEAITDTTWSRFRLTTSGNLGPSGATVDGKVEDHELTIVEPNASDPVFDTHNTNMTLESGGYSTVQVADLDGDGDTDFIGTDWRVEKVAWYENNGSEQFTERIISMEVDWPTEICVADLDGDGDPKLGQGVAGDWSALNAGRKTGM